MLKGFISLAKCLFPPNTTGARLDSFARQALWNVGLDYRHGTGHGVGCCLNVHEGSLSSPLYHLRLSLSIGPQSIGTRVRSDNYLVPGMILSDGWLSCSCFSRIEFC